MHKFIAKIARLAASKAAAFVYAVAVGVAGNLAFNFVQEHHHPIPPAVAPERALATTGLRMPTPPHPVRTREETGATTPIATAPILPDPPPVALPSPDALPAPMLKPTALPEQAQRPAALPEHLLKPVALPSPAPKPAALPAAVPEPAPLRPREETALATQEPASKTKATAVPPASALDTATAAASEPQAAPAPLPPLGPAVDVSALPEPPAEPGKVIAASRSAHDEAARPSDTAAKHQPWELSDIWHPGRAVQKGMHWADDQLPVVGGADAQPRFPAVGPPAPSASPIPLLPPATQSNLSDNSSGLRPSGKPGPGSGGLY